MARAFKADVAMIGKYFRIPERLPHSPQSEWPETFSHLLLLASQTKGRSARADFVDSVRGLLHVSISMLKWPC